MNVYETTIYRLELSIQEVKQLRKLVLVAREIPEEIQEFKEELFYKLTMILKDNS